MKLEAVTFSNKEGERLFGILETPRDARIDAVVVLLSPGVKMRVGPNQLYRSLGRIFADQGFQVLRFDFSGLGDSEGEIAERQLAKVYNAIVDGTYVNDTLSALDWLEARTGCQTFIVGGLCGGAMTGLLAGREDERIMALLGLGIPVSFDGGEADYWRYVTDGELRGMKTRYFRNLMRPRSWARFLTFRSDYRIIFKMLARLFKDRFGWESPQNAPVEKAKPTNLNPKFSPAFFEFVARGNPLLVIFGSQDRWRSEFIEKFEQQNHARLESATDFFQLVTVANANHILSSPEAQNILERTLQRWLTAKFPRDSHERPLHD